MNTSATNQVMDAITGTILKHYPETAAVYLFGSCFTENERKDSDVDLARLLPPSSPVRNLQLALGECRGELAQLLGKEVDLLNLSSFSLRSFRRRLS
ncbi:MAG: nucleotidyltransferase domain-containing protein [Chlorobiaceae bacterium]